MYAWASVFLLFAKRAAAKRNLGELKVKIVKRISDVIEKNRRMSREI
jgi:hypothetical protein